MSTFKYKVNQNIIINPTYKEREEGKLDFEILACGKDETINMIETTSYEVNESDIATAFESSISIHQQIETWQKEIVSELGKTKQPEPVREIPIEITELFEKNFKTKLSKTIFNNTAGKSHIYELKTNFLEAVKEAETGAVLAREIKVAAPTQKGTINKIKRLN